MLEQCPSLDTLARIRHGEADDATLDHVSRCKTCTEKVNELENDWCRQKQADIQALAPSPKTIEQAIQSLAKDLETNFDCLEVRFIGKGGQSPVFEVTRLTGEGESRLLAKIVDVEYVADFQPHADAHRLRSRLRREYSIAEGLNHENIYRVKHFRELKKTSVLWMERVQGGSLSEVSRQRSFTLSDAFSLLKQMAQALDYNLKRNIVHRDLSPANIVYDEQSNRFVLIDYGLAKKLPTATAETVSHAGFETIEGMPMGTRGFASDEQWSNASAAKYPTDIYALARVTLWLLSSAEGRQQIEHCDKNYRMPAHIPAGLKGLLEEMQSPSQNLRPDPVSLLKRVELLEHPLEEQSRAGIAQHLKSVWLWCFCAMASLLLLFWPGRATGLTAPTARVSSAAKWSVADGELICTNSEPEQAECIDFGEFRDVEIEFAISCDPRASVTVFGPTTDSQFLALVLDGAVPPVNRLLAHAPTAEPVSAREDPVPTREQEAYGATWKKDGWKQIRIRVADDAITSWCAVGLERAVLDNTNRQRISGLAIDKGVIGLRIESKLARIRDLRITDLQTKRIFAGPPKKISQTKSIFLDARS